MLEDQRDVGRPIARGDEARRSGPGDTKAVPEGRKTEDRDRADRTPDQDSKSGSDASEAKRPNLLRRHPFWALGLAVAVVAIAAGAYAYWLTALHPYESTDDAFVDARQFSIAPKVAGYIVDVPVTDNQHVEAGTVLFQIDRRDYEVALAQARAQVASAEASIRNFAAQIEGQKAQIEASQAEVTQADASLKFAREDAARYRDLAEKGAGTIQRSQSSTSTLDQQQAGLDRAKANVVAARTQVGALAAQKAGAEANLAMGRAQVAQAELNLGYTTVTAAQPGRLVQLSGAKGQYAQAGQTLSTLVPDDIWVIANYKETQITDMRPGQHADLEIDAYPARKITGHVDSVQPGSGTAFSLLPAQNATGNYVKVVQRIPVKIVVDRWPPDLAIGPGMSIVPRVHVR
ncbi:HlyD family secretion protein [Methylobacterium sp. J-090]|uniref:HlyD family secretion protein n=1 Tax=Methylobacterium sp. J-090 TaxID=2836666 RepID=UPI001FB98A98|nr:HlyD family secretion protein [Methylobacterium sp. J-090]MCJ2080032.1 HlyD family secretion protein [Methylobacterium sp. J-090]